VIFKMPGHGPEAGFGILQEFGAEDREALPGRSEVADADLWGTFEVMGSPLEEVPFTELIQHPTTTTGRLAGVRALRIRRRDADDLVLMSADRADREGEVIDLTARLLAALLAENGGADLIRRVLPTILPWVRFLPAGAVDELAVEFVATTRAAAAVNNMTPVSQLLTEWRNTAEVYADPQLAAVLARPHEGDYGPVPVPDEAA
jgi:hypothetical protein